MLYFDNILVNFVPNYASRQVEENAKYIKVDDWAIVERFFKDYLVREQVTGKGEYKDTSHIFTEEKVQEAFSVLFTVIDKMYQKVVYRSRGN